MTSEYWNFIKSMFAQIFNFTLPWGIAFGAVIVGVFGLPVFIRAYKKFF